MASSGYTKGKEINFPLFLLLFKFVWMCAAFIYAFDFHQAFHWPIAFVSASTNNSIAVFASPYPLFLFLSFFLFTNHYYLRAPFICVMYFFFLYTRNVFNLKSFELRCVPFGHDLAPLHQFRQECNYSYLKRMKEQTKKKSLKEEIWCGKIRTDVQWLLSLGNKTKWPWKRWEMEI